MHKLVTDAQYGFLKGRSTELQLLNCTDSWIKNIDKRLFADFTKAFDSVFHPKLLYKLTCYGISGHILKWFTSFLNNIKQRVKVGDGYSDYVTVTSGVPQGSCTGPLPFILYANYLPDDVSDLNTVVQLFEDDTKLKL